MRLYLGRHVFGLAAVGFGVFALVWHDFNIWQQIRALGNVPHREILVYIVAASRSSAEWRFKGAERR